MICICVSSGCLSIVPCTRLISKVPLSLTPLPMGTRSAPSHGILFASAAKHETAAVSYSSRLVYFKCSTCDSACIALIGYLFRTSVFVCASARLCLASLHHSRAAISLARLPWKASTSTRIGTFLKLCGRHLWRRALSLSSLPPLPPFFFYHLPLLQFISPAPH